MEEALDLQEHLLQEMEVVLVESALESPPEVAVEAAHGPRVEQEAEEERGETEGRPEHEQEAEAEEPEVEVDRRLYLRLCPRSVHT